jgi:hypothetical protein
MSFSAPQMRQPPASLHFTETRSQGSDFETGPASGSVTGHIEDVLPKRRKSPWQPGALCRNKIRDLTFCAEGVGVSRESGMPRRRIKKLQPKVVLLQPRIALPASELEGKIMAMLRGRKACSKLKGVGLVYCRQPRTGTQLVRPSTFHSCLTRLQTRVRYCPRKGEEGVRSSAPSSATTAC